MKQDQIMRLEKVDRRWVLQENVFSAGMQLDLLFEVSKKFCSI